jgi:hypothetical protein
LRDSTDEYLKKLQNEMTMNKAIIKKMNESGGEEQERGRSPNKFSRNHKGNEKSVTAEEIAEQNRLIREKEEK